MTKLDHKVEDRIHFTYRDLMGRGELMSPETLRAAYSAFNERFGPRRLRDLEGETLLQAMFTHGNKDSMVYWLEFKNDEDFQSPRFGSIAGGSAHKFGLFRRAETGQWVTGGPRNESAISVQEAVKLATARRDQLLDAVRAVEKLSENALHYDEAYEDLQRHVEAVAPDIAKLAWAHKYLSLIFPEKLDDYHNPKWQRFNLIKLLEQPPRAEGLYTCAGRYARLAQEFGWPMNHLTTVLTAVHGAPTNYWRIGTRLGEGPDAQEIWPAMRAGGYVAIGWDWIGDLSEALETDDPKAAIFERLGPDAQKDQAARTRKSGEIVNFAQRIEDGDVVLAASGQTILGVGIVRGDYRFETSSPADAPHRRAVEWRSVEPWQMPNPEGLRTTVTMVHKHEENLVEAERRLLSGGGVPIRKKELNPPAAEILGGIAGQMQAILERKGQVILYGPPGTGKTYWARAAARNLAALSAFGKLYADLGDDEIRQVDGKGDKLGLVRTCTFHPAYGYEDFIEGYRPETNAAGALSFRHHDGIFKQLCTDAAKVPERQFFLLIDEINRGDIPRIFGELLTLLENDKRGLELSLPVSGRLFTVPKNVRVIGTMNTADRSIALLDTALRRRFGFVELLPDTHLFGGAMVGDAIPLGPWLAALNGRIREHLGRDARNLQIGHAYFLHSGKPVTDLPRFVRILAEDVIPLLQEYCYEDFGLLEKLLGEGLVDGATQTIRGNLFEPANHELLTQALLAPSPEIVTSSEAKPATETDEDAEAESDES